MNGTFSPKTVLKAFPTNWERADLLNKLLEALLLLGSGVLAVVLHRIFDSSPGLPGHHGIEWMALLIMGRSFSRFRGAGSLAGIGASLATAVPFLHTSNPFTWLFYLLPGPIMDLAFRYLPRYADKLWFLMALGGLAHVTKPLGQLIINLIFGWPFGSFRFGVVYPVASHLLYGVIGGLLGALLVLGIQHISPKSNS
jgi:hypothetical protein